MRAQGLSITTIVIAALAIIVLIIVTMLVMQRTNLFGIQLRNVSEQKCPGDVMPIGTRCNVIYGSFNLPPDKICCEAQPVPEPVAEPVTSS